MRTATAAILACAALLTPAAAQEPRRLGGAPAFTKERIVLRTRMGDLVLVLYPEVAPRHVAQILRLARLGAYDSTHIFRIEPGFLIQLSNAEDRTNLITDEQRAAIENIPVELSDLKHRRGTLSMARFENDPNGARTSFSILAATAPHLDGKYTIFGQLESGHDVLDAILRLPRDSHNRPYKRLAIDRAVVTENPKAELKLRGPPPKSEEADHGPRLHGGFLGGILAAVILLGLAQFIFANRLGPRGTASLGLSFVLIAWLGVFFMALTVSRDYPNLAAFVFFGSVVLFKLMSRFEAK